MTGDQAMSDHSKFFRPAEYFKPTSVKDAIKLLARYGNAAWPIAGGTDLMVDKNPQVNVLVVITGLGLEYITFNRKGLAIGAATTIADIGASLVLRRGPYYILAKSARELGTPQIRNMTTIGGNICRPSPGADCAPPLLVLDAVLNVASVNGKRQIRIDEFFMGVNEDALQQGEIVTEILLPAFPERTRTAFIKKGRVAAGDLSIVSVAVCLILDKNDICEDVRIALGSVAPIPIRVKKAESLLKGRAPMKGLLNAVADQASEEIKPVSDIRASAEYRRTLSRILLERALSEALGQIV
jgi:CO/xanthine dehydrogenase FAD-binding subunit